MQGCADRRAIQDAIAPEAKVDLADPAELRRSTQNAACRAVPLSELVRTVTPALQVTWTVVLVLPANTAPPGRLTPRPTETVAVVRIIQTFNPVMTKPAKLAQCMTGFGFIATSTMMKKRCPI